MTSPAPSPAPTLGRARLAILAAAVLWSLSGGFTKILTQPTAFGLDTPRLDPLQIAFYRAFFAGLVLSVFLRRGEVSYRPTMPAMVVIFAVMNGTFVSAQAYGPAANAILLQYTAPLWIYLFGVLLLGEKADMRNLAAIGLGVLGIAIIVVGGAQQDEQLPVIGLGLASGLSYAGVLLCLRALRGESSRWLTVLNHLGAAVMLSPFLWGKTLPSAGQLVFLFLFGAVQMGLPYFLMAWGLRTVNTQEAGTITLLEPLLNPCWAFLVAGEAPNQWTFVGGAFILGALVYRYWPWQGRESVSE